jgi:hypothetical protein
MLLVSACRVAPPDVRGSGNAPGQTWLVVTADSSAPPGAPSSALVTWQAANGSNAYIFVSKDGAPPQLFASGPRGQQDAPWIEEGARYTFRMYADDRQEMLLAEASFPESGPGAPLVARLRYFWSFVRDELAVIALALASAVTFAAGLVWSWHGSDWAGRGLLWVSSALALCFALTIVGVVKPVAMQDQPFPDAAEYADAAHQLAVGNGYVTYVADRGPQYRLNDAAQPPRYPPGVSLALAPFALAGTFPANVQIGSKVLTGLYVAAAYYAAVALGGPIAATLTVLALGVAPFVPESAALTLSDAFAACITVLSVALLHRPSAGKITAVGLISGAALLIRLTAVVNIAAFLLAVPNRFRLRLAIMSVPGGVALAIYQWRTFGSPLRTGYDYYLPGLKNFGREYLLNPLGRDGPWVYGDRLHGALMNWVCPCPVGGPEAALPNIVFYAAVVVGAFWVIAPPFAPIVGLFEAYRRRRDPAAAAALWLTIGSACFFSFYFYQAGRFVAGPVTVLLVFGAAAAAGSLRSALSLGRAEAGVHERVKPTAASVTQ